MLDVSDFCRLFYLSCDLLYTIIPPPPLFFSELYQRDIYVTTHIRKGDWDWLKSRSRGVVLFLRCVTVQVLVQMRTKTSSDFSVFTEIETLTPVRVCAYPEEHLRWLRIALRGGEGRGWRSTPTQPAWLSVFLCDSLAPWGQGATVLQLHRAAVQKPHATFRHCCEVTEEENTHLLDKYDLISDPWGYIGG